MNKLIFLPFDPKHERFVFAQNEYGTMPGGFNKVQLALDHELQKGRAQVAVWWQSGVRDPFLSSMSTGQIYIRGHGVAGMDSIEGGRGGERVNSKLLADRLIEAGLPKAYDGKIKLFNCHSAETGSSTLPDGQTNMMPGFVGTAFAQLVADELFSRGYRSCSFFGYTGAIDSFPKPGTQGQHYYVREIGKNAAGNLAQLEGPRAKDARVQFWPRTTASRKTTVFGRMLGFGRR
ncbi:hypothetical protein FHT86_000293 [Rhizobium sp. BK313]|jgi:hypothetical protein|uniref:hypothetical protein n=1 Tax=Rhizobium sp. BK313 TaxID=2587081 RepID=UPI001060CF75|nr:hypothetical protein [Rhizobium sp. BK313]MBB3452037.1 hypothetical protein [Rhizobium sp. BK313]